MLNYRIFDLDREEAEACKKIGVPGRPFEVSFDTLPMGFTCRFQKGKETSDIMGEEIDN